MIEDPSPGTSIPSLLRSLREDTTTLIRQEVSLAKAELTLTARELGKRSVALVVGAIVCVFGGFALVTAVSNLVTSLLIMAHISPVHAVWMGPLVVGAITLIVGFSMIKKAIKAFSAENLMPSQTIQSVKETAQWTKRKI